jgi:hypothetical protein
MATIYSRHWRGVAKTRKQLGRCLLTGDSLGIHGWLIDNFVLRVPDRQRRCSYLRCFSRNGSLSIFGGLKRIGSPTSA